MTAAFDPGWLKTCDDLLKAQTRAGLAWNKIQHRGNSDHQDYDPEWMPYPPTAPRVIGSRFAELVRQVKHIINEGPRSVDADEVEAVISELDEIAETSEWVLGR